MASKYGIQEFADGLGDVVELLDDDGIRSAFKKGQNFEMLKFILEAGEAYPKVKEFIDDWAVWSREAGDLDLNEKDEVLAIIKERHPNPDELQAKVIEVFETAGFGYEYIAGMVIGGAKEMVARVNKLFGKSQEV